MTPLPRMIATAITICSILTTPASAVEPDQCRKVTFADTGWSDVTAITALATTILQGLNYETEIKPLTLPSTYNSLATDDVDVFLGQRMPLMKAYGEIYRDRVAIDVVRANLTGARYALATNKHGAVRGIKDLTDIATHKEALEGKIYAVEPESIANRILLEMVADDQFQLGTFEIVESSVQGMLAHLDRANKLSESMVFLAWEPHPVIAEMKPSWLTGGDDIFGPDQGTAEVQTITRQGYAGECQNVANILNNLFVTVEIQNKLIDEIFTQNTAPDIAARNWLKNNPEILTDWLNNVTTIEGNDPHSALRIFLDE